MNIEDSIGYQANVPACVVCGKNVQGDNGFARINHNGTMLNLCCPLCLETFQSNAAPYLARLAKVEYREALKQSAK